MSELSRWADSAMYRADPMPVEARAEGGGVRPVVTLLNATPDPLGSLAAIAGIYEGRVLRSLSEVTDEQRRATFADMMATVLNGPLEVAQFHFLIEGVTRSFTHQAVRSRAAFFAQESLRFAVPEENWIGRTAYPPSLARKPIPSHIVTGGNYDDGPEWSANPEYTENERAYDLKRDAWNDAIISAQKAYQQLVDSGIPAEDARGLIPHALTTRYHWVVDLRTLLAEAGKRTCTQAQFEWRLVMAGVAKALRSRSEQGCYHCDSEDGWQFGFIADQLRPYCYQSGACGFMAKFDRGCKIRERVELNAKAGRPSSEWAQTKYCHPEGCNHPEIEIDAINPAEWAADPGAAR